MSVLAVDRALMRDVLLPGLALTPGRALMARVVTAESGHGTLAIAGYLIDAALPDDVRPGQDLRLVIRDLDAHRVLLAVQEHPESGSAPAETAPETAAPAPAGPPPSVLLPGGAVLRALIDEDAGGGGGGRPGSGESRTIGLRFEGAGLGAVELRLSIDPATLAVNVTLSDGEPLHRGRAGAPALREALLSGSERPVTLTVGPRRRPDLYA